MVLENSFLLPPHQNAENIHFLEQTQDPERVQRFQEEQYLDQSSKFTSYNFLATMDVKFSVTRVHYHSNWKHTQDAAYWFKLSRAQDQELRYWQTKSNATIVHNSVLADCIDKVISQRGDRTLFERLPTPRPAPRVTLWSSWHSQQQHPQPLQQRSDSASSSVWKQMPGTSVQNEDRENRGNTTETQFSSDIW